MAKSTLAHPQGQRDITRASASCGRYWLAGAKPWVSIQWTSAVSSAVSGRFSGIEAAIGGSPFALGYPFSHRLMTTAAHWPMFV